MEQHRVASGSSILEAHRRRHTVVGGGVVVSHPLSMLPLLYLYNTYMLLEVLEVLKVSEALVIVRRMSSGVADEGECSVN